MNASWARSRQHKATGSAPHERSGCLPSVDTRQRGVTQWDCECYGQMGSYNTQGRRWSRTSCSFVGTLCGFHHTAQEAHQRYTACQHQELRQTPPTTEAPGKHLISECPRWVYHCLSNSFPPEVLRNAVCANDSGSSPPASFTHWASDFWNHVELGMSVGQNFKGALSPNLAE